MNSISTESEKAKEAVRNVMRSPDRLTHWQGNRRRKFDSQVVSDMQRLQNAILMIDDAAKEIRKTIQFFIDADK